MPQRVDVFYLHLDQIPLCNHCTWFSQSGAIGVLPNWGVWKELSVFNIFCKDIARLLFISIPHFWVCLTVITSIVTKHSRLLHAHQNHWCWYVGLMTIITFFFLFHLIVPGNKVDPNHMIVRQALITDKRQSTLFWGCFFRIKFFFLFLFYSVSEVFEEQASDLVRLRNWDWAFPVNFLKGGDTALVCRKSRFWVSLDARALSPMNAYLPIHQWRNVCGFLWKQCLNPSTCHSPSPRGAQRTCISALMICVSTSVLQKKNYTQWLPLLPLWETLSCGGSVYTQNISDTLKSSMPYLKRKWFSLSGIDCLSCFMFAVDGDRQHQAIPWFTSLIDLCEMPWNSITTQEFDLKQCI